MDSEETRKLRILLVLQVLQREACKTAPVTMRSLLERLQAGGVCAERKAVGRDFSVLRRAGYPVRFTRTPYPGYYLARRELDPAEVRLLLDAVSAAPFLTEEETRRLTEKLQALADPGERAVLRQQVYYDAGRKQHTAGVPRTIRVLQTAVDAGRKVTFWYHHRALQGTQVDWDAGRRFVVSPYALFWREDHYYLAANYEKYDTVANYRLDRMAHVQMLPDAVRPFSEITPFQQQFDTPAYLRNEFYLFGGKPEQLLLSCSRRLLDVVADRFGAGLAVLEADDRSFTAHVQVEISEGLYAWLLQCGAELTVLSPTYVRDGLRQRLLRLCAAYRVPVSGEAHVLQKNLDADAN